MSESIKNRINISLNSEHIPVDNSIIIENMRKLASARSSTTGRSRPSSSARSCVDTLA